MLGILNKKCQAKVAKDFYCQFMFLMGKMEDGYQILFNLVKSTWKSINISKDTMFDIIVMI